MRLGDGETWGGELRGDVGEGEWRGERDDGESESKLNSSSWVTSSNALERSLRPPKEGSVGLGVGILHNPFLSLGGLL